MREKIRLGAHFYNYTIPVASEIKICRGMFVSELVVKYNELTAEQFIELWETVWGDWTRLLH